MLTDDHYAAYAARAVADELGATLTEFPLHTPDGGESSYDFPIMDGPTEPAPQTSLETLRDHSPLRLIVQLESLDTEGEISVHITAGMPEDSTVIETISVNLPPDDPSPISQREYTVLVDALTPAELRDYIAIEVLGFDKQEWERLTGLDHSNTSTHVRIARNKLESGSGSVSR